MRRDASRSATTTSNSTRAGALLARSALAALAVACVALLVAGSAAAAPTEIDSFDGTGTEAGAFGGVFDVAVDEVSGDVYVLNQAYDSVARFSSTGTFISELKGSETPAATYGFNANVNNAVVVDNTGGAGQGDVYVLARTSHTIFKLDFDSTPSVVWAVPAPPGSPCGLAMDPEGILWAAERNSAELTPYDAATGAPTADTFPPIGLEQCNMAFGNDGSLYTADWWEGFEKFAPDGSSIAIGSPSDLTFAVATSLSRNDVFSVARQGATPTIEQWDENGGSISSTEGIAGTNYFQGIALDGIRNRLYVADINAALIRIYDVPPQSPTVAAKSVTDIGQTSATLHADVNPNGPDITDCQAEYLTEDEYIANGNDYAGAVTVSCTPGAPISGVTEVEVSASATGLQPDTPYRSRFVATSGGGTTEGDDVLFTTEPIDPPTVTTGSASAIAQAGATLAGTVNPNGFATSCKFQYGTSTGYGSEVAATDPGAGSGEVDVSASVGGLNAGTDYHFRLVCTNGGGTSNGSDAAFKTLAAVITNPPPPPPKPPIEEDGAAYATCVKQANLAAKKAKKAAGKKKGKAKARAIRAANKKRAKAIKACKARYL